MQKTRPFHWYCLILAILFEVGGSTIMKMSQGWDFAHAALFGLLLMWLGVGLSYYFLALSTQGMPIGVAYAFWEGLGLVLVTLSSIFLLHEHLGLNRLLGLICVLIGAFLIDKGTSHGHASAKKH